MASRKSTKKAPAKVAEKNQSKQNKMLPAPAPALDLQGLGLEEIRRADEKPLVEKLRAINAIRTKNPTRFSSSEDLSMPYYLRRPTGIIELDIALAGGFPAGGCSMLSGPYSSGKTWLLWRMFALQQQIYGDAFCGAIAPTEGPLDFKRMRECGVNISIPDPVIEQMITIRAQDGEPPYTQEELASFKTQTGHFTVITGETGEDILGGILELYETGHFSLIGLDSIQGLLPKVEVGKELDDQAMRASSALLQRKFWPRFSQMTVPGRNNTTLMMIQQVVQRDKSNLGFAAKYYTDWDVKSPESTKHFKVVDLALYDGEKLKYGDPVQVVGKVTNWKTLKGKAGVHEGLTGEYNFYRHLNGPDNAGDLITSAVTRGVIVEASDGLTVINTTTKAPLDAQRFSSQQEIRERIYRDPRFELLLRHAILHAAGIQRLYR